ncbi:MAG: septum formation initiator family protein [Deltaproteobacteria bacterium]|nr:septum formation initiator family protein [Deltaproteobacteria bacterium]
MIWAKDRAKRLLAIGFGLVLASLLVFSDSGLLKVFFLSQQKTHLEQETERLREDIDALSKQAELLRSDDETIAQAIRERLDKTDPRDTIFIFTDEDRAAVGSSAP